MEGNILSKITKETVDLSIIRITIDFERIGNEGLQLLCSQKLSHINHLHLGKTMDI
jgi:hypothetical protein